VRLRKTLIAVIFAATALMTAGAYAQRVQEWDETFEARERVRINTISGDVEIVKGGADKILVHIRSSYRPADSFEPKMRERRNAVYLEEEMYGSNRGNAVWTITVPEGTIIDFKTASGDMRIADMKGAFSASSASGDFYIEKCSGEFDFNTASGDIELVNCTGYFDASTASGDIDIDDCQGEFDVNTASGDVEGIEVTFTDESRFNTASGSVEIVLAQTVEHDLEISTASGRVILDYNGHPMKGHYEFISKHRNGRVSAPFDFDEEHVERFRRWGDRYVRQTYTKDSDTPYIELSTASGKVSLHE